MMLTTLIRASIDGAIVVAIVWILIRALPRLSARTRTILWWCAAAKFVIGLVWVSPILVPILPPEHASTLPLLTGPMEFWGSAAAVVEPVSTDSSGDWWMALTSAWAAGVFLALGVGVSRWRETRTLVGRSERAPLEILAMTAELADRVGLSRVPRVALSDRIDTPLVTGLWRPVVLLPSARFDLLSERQQRMALCHELAHVKRRDLWFGCGPALAECLFFFHPLAHLAGREYALWREATCDAEVLDALDAAPQEYGRLLLDLGVTRKRTGLAAAGASWSFLSLKRRIAMLPAPSSQSAGSRLVAATAIGLSVIALVPLQLSARRPSNEPPALPAVTEPEPVDERKLLGEQKKEGELNYVMFLDDDTTTMSGSTKDIKLAKRFKRPGESLLWFRHEGREYLVRDPAILRQVEAIWIPVHEVGARQSKLGAEQAIIGAKQGELGAKQSVIGADQARIGALQSSISAQQAMLAAQERAQSTLETRRALENAHRELEGKTRDLEQQMKMLEAKMQEYEKPMRDLVAEMEALGEKMEDLGRKMEDASLTAQGEMRVLLENAIKSGAATLVK